ncbi:MAG: transposase [Chloroflexi bacterium]|nr:transposase [Chloroflexota bacterium]
MRFSRRDCSPCPVRTQCTRRQVEPRELVLQPRVEHEALQAARRHQQTEDFKVQYAARAGVEGTHAQAVRRAGLRRSRYIGLAKSGQPIHVAPLVSKPHRDPKPRMAFAPSDTFVPFRRNGSLLAQLDGALVEEVDLVCKVDDSCTSTSSNGCTTASTCPPGSAAFSNSWPRLSGCRSRLRLARPRQRHAQRRVAAHQGMLDGGNWPCSAWSRSNPTSPRASATTARCWPTATTWMGPISRCTCTTPVTRTTTT